MAWQSRDPTSLPAACVRPVDNVCTWCSGTWPRAGSTTGTASGECCRTWHVPVTPVLGKEVPELSTHGEPGTWLGSCCQSTWLIPILLRDKLRLGKKFFLF